jgi:hypothetical protein
MMRYVSALVAFASFASALHAEPLWIAPFEADITPPIGAPLCDALVQPAKQIDDPLFARGLVIFPDGKPIVLCALDWVGIGNTGHDAFRACQSRRYFARSGLRPLSAPA